MATDENVSSYQIEQVPYAHCALWDHQGTDYQYDLHGHNDCVSGSELGPVRKVSPGDPEDPTAKVSTRVN